MAKATKPKGTVAANGKHASGKVRANGSPALAAKSATTPGKAAKAAKTVKTVKGAKAEPDAAAPGKVATRTKAERARSSNAAKPAKATRKRPAPKPGFFESFLKLFR